MARPEPTPPRRNREGERIAPPGAGPEGPRLRPISGAGPDRRAEIWARVTNAVDYLFYILYGLLGIRFVLALLGASEQAGFVRFIHGVTAPFHAPFDGIVSRPGLNGGVLDFPVIIALLAYVLLHVAARGLIHVVAGRAAG